MVRSIATPLADYARWKGVSWEGCHSKEDVDFRAAMLKNITKGHEEGWLRR